MLPEMRLPGELRWRFGYRTTASAFVRFVTFCESICGILAEPVRRLDDAWAWAVRGSGLMSEATRFDTRTIGCGHDGLHTTEAQRRETARGAIAATGAFLLWGVLPVYWKLLHGVQPLEVIAHRIVWSLVFLLFVLRVRGRLRQFREALVDPRQLALYGLSGGLLGVNWLTYIFAVQASHIVEASLGYFLVPLCNVALGFLVLRERLRPMQWTAVALAAAGVMVQLARVGRLPWIALVLAGTFAIYGLLRKRGPLGSLTGLGVETALLAPLACGYLVWRQSIGAGALGSVDLGRHVLLFACGVATAVPLLWFATAARALSMASLGLFQYLAPTVQLLIGVVLYAEPFDGARAGSFLLIWAGLALYSADAFRAGRRAAVAAPEAGGR